MNPIKTALLSFGMSGRVFHAPFLHLNEQFSLVGSWERSLKRIQQAYSYTRSFDSLEEILSDADIELVVVNTPIESHFEYAKAALEAGKHVIVEKAFTTTAQEAKLLKALAEEKNLMLSVFHNRRWDSGFSTVQDVLNKQVLGDIVETTISFARFRAELSPKLHKEEPNAGAGIVKDLGSHLIDQAIVLFGMPQKVFADISITRESSKVDDYFDILLKYPNHSVHLKGGYFFREAPAGYELHGTKGSFIKSRGDVQEDQLQDGITPDNPIYGLEAKNDNGLLHTELEGLVFRKEINTNSGNYGAYYDGIADAIKNKKPAPVTAQDGINVMTIIDAAFESQRTEKMIVI